jgi:hypothetical protein
LIKQVNDLDSAVSELDTKVKNLETNAITEEWLKTNKYLTETSLSNYCTKDVLDDYITKISLTETLKDYASEKTVSTNIANLTSHIGNRSADEKQTIEERLTDLYEKIDTLESLIKEYHMENPSEPEENPETT